MTYSVEIVARATGEVINRIECGNSYRDAERVERGVLINNNHKDFFTRIACGYTEPQQ